MNYKNLPFFQFKNADGLEFFLYKMGQEYRLKEILELMKRNSVYRRKKLYEKLEIIKNWWNEIDDFEKLSSNLFETHSSAYILLFYLKKYIVEKEIKKLKEKLNKISITN